METSATKIEECRNCGATLQAKYCHECGQEKLDHLIPVRHLLGDIADEFLKFDSKLFRTLTSLMVRPGFLTSEYIAGRRARYLPPFRLYFTISAIYFLIAASLNFNDRTANYIHQATGNQSSLIETAKTNHKESRAAVSGIRMPVKKTPIDRARLDRAVTKYSSWYLGNQNAIMFFLVPWGALILKFLYWRSGRLYIEHLVFSVHVTSFMFLSSLPSLPLFGTNQLSMAADAFLLISVATVVYVIVAMRRVYHESPLKTFLKAIGLFTGYAFGSLATGIIAFLYFLMTS